MATKLKRNFMTAEVLEALFQKDYSDYDFSSYDQHES